MYIQLTYIDTYNKIYINYITNIPDDSLIPAIFVPPFFIQNFYCSSFFINFLYFLKRHSYQKI